MQIVVFYGIDSNGKWRTAKGTEYWIAGLGVFQGKEEPLFHALKSKLETAAQSILRTVLFSQGGGLNTHNKWV